ncbi:MAG: peptide/nickel transport system substrate-binding protein [Mycobacterium sp.]|jgi:peptide/nickel transport system substrate-binding protein|nr:peptide/nickel transport system substrate-binding protein [Mycobacterium sp.]
MPRRSWPAAVVAAGLLIAPAALTSCASTPADQVDYVVDGPLTTYNANSVVGAASAAPQAFGRVLTGFGYHGPDGQVVADHDVGTVSVVGREPLLLDYTIADSAVYSDGKPITCDDMVLAWAAQSGRLPGFDAASRAGYSDIESVDCTPGQKKARVTFAPSRPFADYPQLFTATSLMPSHVLADLLGVDVTTALQNNDATVVAKIADAWNTLWDLKPGVNLRWFPSSGPYKLDSVRSDGAVVLVVNDRWWATKPITKRVIVYPRAADVPQRLKDSSADVVDIASGLVGGLTVPNGYERVDTASGGIQQLILSDEGALAAPAARRALALCTPRDVIARDAGVPIANVRLNPALDDAFAAGESTAANNQYAAANADAAKAALNGTPLTVRIGYQAPNARLGGAVKAIATACAPAGITVQDAATDHTGPQSIKNKEIEVLLASTGGAVGSGSSASSSIDAYALHTANGNNLSGYSNPQVDGIIDNLAITSDAKEIARLLGDSAGVLWNDMPTLPLYRQQRTVISSKKMEAVTPNPTRWGAGWNMDRWALRE